MQRTETCLRSLSLKIMNMARAFGSVHNLIITQTEQYHYNIINITQKNIIYELKETISSISLITKNRKHIILG